VVELDTGTISIGEAESLASVGIADIVISSTRRVDEVSGQNDSGTPGGGGSFGGGIPVTVNAEPAYGTVVGNLNDLTSPCKVTGIGHAIVCLGIISVSGLQICIPISKRNTALRNTSVTVNDEADISSASSPGRVNWHNTKADNLDILFLVGTGGESLELGHTVGWRLDVEDVCVVGILRYIGRIIGGGRSQSAS
jgi:hypothetical protein